MAFFILYSLAAAFTFAITWHSSPKQRKNNKIVGTWFVLCWFWPFILGVNILLFIINLISPEVKDD